MNLVKEFYGTVIIFVFIAAIAFGVTVGSAAIPIIIPELHRDSPHGTIVQEAKCEIQADLIYKTTDKNDVFLPLFVNRCMTAAGFTFIGMQNAICEQNYKDAMQTGQLDQAGGYDMSTDPSCYVMLSSGFKIF